MGTQVIALGGWKGAQIPVTFATPEEATILREAVNTYLRLFALAGDASQTVCEQFIAVIDEQLRNNQPAQPPQPSLTPPSLNASATGGPSNQFSVNSDGDTAPWTANANTSWLIVIDPTSPQTGDGTVTYAVMANSGAARNGTITISGFNLTFPVSQAAGTVSQTDQTAGAQTADQTTAQGIL
jgi:hypothetical protein